MLEGVGLSGRRGLTRCKTQATWALERHSQKDTQGRAHTACTQTRSPTPFPTPPSPEQAHSPAFTSSQHTPVWEAPGPAHDGRRLYLPTWSVSPSTCAPGPVFLLPGYRGHWPSPHLPSGGSSSSSVTPALSSGSAPAVPPPQLPGEPHSYLTGQLPSGSLIPFSTSHSCPSSTASSHPPVSSKFSLPAGREIPSSSHDPEGPPLLLVTGDGGHSPLSSRKSPPLAT